MIPFRGYECLGVVWEIEKGEETEDLKPITRVLTSLPLVRAPHRRLIEFMSQKGLCSLSTALYTWMPAGLRGPKLTTLARSLIESYNAQPVGVIPAKQHAIISPGYRPYQREQLEAKFSERFTEVFKDTESLSIRRWFAIAAGEIQVALGREGALFAPWNNLGNITLVEPEDIAYYHEQTPYFSLIDVAKELARATNATFTMRSYLPEEGASLLWGTESQGQSFPKNQIDLVDLRREPLLNDTLLDKIQACIKEGKQALLLYNAHDRSLPAVDSKTGERVVLPGIETISKRLAHALGRESLPSQILLGTRSLLHVPHSNVGLTAILSLDPLLAGDSFANLMHGIGDIGHLISYPAPCVIQTKKPDHPLSVALANGLLESYVHDSIVTQRDSNLPPFGEHIVCSFPEQENAEAELKATFERLSSLQEDPWQVSHPFATKWRKRDYHHILIHAPADSRLPLQIREYLLQLERPWKIQHNPWYLL
jgi:primosomal protein N'